jgi:adenylate cyclase
VKDGLRVTWVELLRRLAPVLPADLFAQLRTFSSLTFVSSDTERTFGETLRQAISALDSLHHTLTNFLPRYVLDLEPTPGQPHGELLRGSFIFADVTGFTALTGELSRRGTAGREEMNRLMRALFAALLEPLLNSGGDLLIFAGDAVLATFPGHPEGRDARWATRTALRLVEAIKPFEHLETPYGTFSLTMSAGVERGDAFAAVVGTQQRMEFLISGGPVQGAMKAEGAAEPGQVVAGVGVLPFLRPEEFALQGSIVAGIHGGELSDYEPSPPARRRSRMSAIFSKRLPDLFENLQEALAKVEALVPFIPPDLFVQIARGEDIRQHPPVAVQFINVLGLEELALGSTGPQQAAAILQRYFVQAHEAVTQREGVISQVDAYAKGFTLLNPFGALTRHEGVPRLAASAALELDRMLCGINREFALDPPLVQRTGLTYARIFTGEIGYRHRREYVVAGPAVNLAARLMAKAEAGQIVLDASAWDAVRADFVAKDLPPIPLKGITDPVPRFLLQGVRKDKDLRVDEYPLVGCQREQAVLETLLEEAAAGRGGALAVVGEAGFGKNFVAAHIIDQARTQGMTVLTGRCHPFSQMTPYAPWKDMVEGWLEVDEESTPDSRRNRLRERLDEFDLVSSLPAFADLLGFAPTHLAAKVEQRGAALSDQGPSLFATLREQADQVEAGVGWGALISRRAVDAPTTFSPRADEERSIWQVLRERASISSALYLLLERLAQRRPTLVVVADAQWLDPDSRKVLSAMIKVAKACSLFVLVTAGSGTEWEGDRIVLSALSDAETEELAALVLRASRLEPDLVSWLLARVNGNPLFIISYCRALRECDAVVVDPNSGEARWSGPPPSLPLSLQGLLLAQVERAGKTTQEALQRSTVLGATFPTWLLTELCRDALSQDELDQALDEAARRSLIAPSPPAQAYAFSSQSLRDAIYAALSHAIRQSWHRQVAERLSGADDASRYEQLEQIAYHYGLGDDAPKAAYYARLAGDKARARQADQAALAHYEQALAISGDGEGIVGERRLAYEGTGDVRALQGDGVAARRAYEAALSGADSEAEHRLKAKLALLAPMLGTTEPEVLEEAQSLLPPSALLRVWLAAALCWVHAERGEADAAQAVCRGLSSFAQAEAEEFTRGMLEAVDEGNPLLPYDDLFALFAPTYLRSTPAPSGGDS